MGNETYYWHGLLNKKTNSNKESNDNEKVNKTIRLCWKKYKWLVEKTFLTANIFIKRWL